MYNLSSLCMLAANGGNFLFFWPGVFALVLQYLFDRFGIHQTTVSRTFSFLLRQLFIISAKG